MDIVKICKKHGALTLNEVWIRNTRKGSDCKHCSREWRQKDRKLNPEKYRSHGNNYRKIILTPDITHRTCSKCKNELPLSSYTPSDRSNRYPYCRKCRNKSTKLTKLRHPETYEKYKQKNKLKYRERALIKKYNLTLEAYRTIHDQQNGVCKICEQPETALQPNGIDIKDLCVDHCHSTGKIRGLLCHGCNAGIGHFQDNTEKLRKAIIYLDDA